MSGPWEKYKASSTSGKPWEKYGNSAQEPGVLATAVGKLASGGSYGLIDELSGGLEAGGQAIGVKGLGGKFKDMGLTEEGPTLDYDTLSKAYKTGRNTERKSQSEMKEAHPWLSGISEFAGGMAIPVGGAATLAGRVGTSAGLGALTGYGMSEDESLTGQASDALQGAVLGGALQYGGEKVLAPALKKLGSMANNAKISQKVGKIFAGVPEEHTAEYLAQKGKISARPDIEIMDDLASRYDTSSSAYDAAKLKLEGQKSALNTTKQALGQQLQEERFASRNSLLDAKQELAEKIQGIRENLKSQNLLGLKENVQSAMANLKNQISQGSSDSYKILDADTGAYSVRSAGKIMRSMAADMNIQAMPGIGQGITPGSVLTPETAAIQNKILQLADAFENTPEAIPARELKKIMQQLDESGQANYGPGFDNRVSKVYKMARRTIDDVIKSNNAGYAEKMQEISGNVQLYDDLLNKFGTDEQIISTLNSIGGLKGQNINADLLNQLGKKAGQDFEAPVKNYLSAQETLKTPSRFQQLVENQPEFQRVQDFKSKVSQLSDPAYTHQYLANDNVTAAQTALSEAEQGFSAAQANLDVFRPVSPGRVQSTMSSASGARDFAPSLNLSKIDAATGVPFSQEIKNRAILNSFEKTDTSGARKTLAGGAVGALFGGPAGTALGAASGFILDKYAGKMFKQLLNGQIAAGQGMESLAPYLGKFAKPIMDAASRGSAAVSATHFLLQQSNPEYREMIRKMGEEGQ